jgi:hypothetical protein
MRIYRSKENRKQVQVPLLLCTLWPYSRSNAYVKLFGV